MEALPGERTRPDERRQAQGGGRAGGGGGGGGEGLAMDGIITDWTTTTGDGPHLLPPLPLWVNTDNNNESGWPTP